MSDELACFSRGYFPLAAAYCPRPPRRRHRRRLRLSTNLFRAEQAKVRKLVLRPEETICHGRIQNISFVSIHHCA
jgi:hypothetical protein